MTCAFPLLWLLFMVIMWVGVIHGFQDASLATDAVRRDTTRIGLWAAALPPTIVFLVTAFVLSLSGPMVQFNVGNSLGMSLWSFWVYSWLPMLACSVLLAVCYLLWTLATFVTRPTLWLRHVVFWAAISSVWGSFVLSRASPWA